LFWIKTDIDDYLIDLFSLEDNVLKRAKQSIIENGMPDISVSANQGQFLFLLAKICKAQRIIEIGTLGGYSSIWLGRALDENGKLTSIEIDPVFARIARENISKANLSERIEVIVGDALTILPKLDKEKTPVDLFFIDADKTQYIDYFNYSLKMSRKGSIIVADNVIREGKILDEDCVDERVIGVRNYLRMLSNNKKVINSIIQNVGNKEHDGMAISFVYKNSDAIYSTF
jgi:predicted O-methyltransferase YrrM